LGEEYAAIHSWKFSMCNHPAKKISIISNSFSDSVDLWYRTPKMLMGPRKIFLLQTWPIFPTLCRRTGRRTPQPQLKHLANLHGDQH
jgi:hypothetical protein